MLARSAGLFFFAGTCLVFCTVILEVTGLEMPESGHIGKFDMFDLSNVPSDGLVQVNDLSLRQGKGAEKLKSNHVI